MTTKQLLFDGVINGDFDRQLPLELQQLAVGDELTITGFGDARRLRGFAHQLFEDLTSVSVIKRGYRHKLNEKDLIYTIGRLY